MRGQPVRGWAVASGPCPACWLWPGALRDPVATSYKGGGGAVPQPPVPGSPGIRAEFAWPHHTPPCTACIQQGTGYHPACTLLAAPDLSPSPYPFTKSFGELGLGAPPLQGASKARSCPTLPSPP